jgi:hypothetical protein
MAQDVWLSWADPHQLLFRGVVPFLYVDGRRAFWERKLRLWTAGCLDRLAVCLPESIISEARQLLEQLADGLLSEGQFAQERVHFSERAGPLVEAHARSNSQVEFEALATLLECLGDDCVEAAEMGALGTSRIRALVESGAHDPQPDPDEELIAVQDPPIVALLREVCGNPFRPITFEPSWRTSDVMLLAQGIYAERAFDRIPILADALQDAGCTSDDILGHCRDTSLKHVRGCWVVDLVLGKE